MMVIQADIGFLIDAIDTISMNNGNCNVFFNDLTWSCTPFSVLGLSQAPNVNSFPIQMFEPQLNFLETSNAPYRGTH